MGLPWTSVLGKREHNIFQTSSPLHIGSQNWFPTFILTGTCMFTFLTTKMDSRDQFGVYVCSTDTRVF